MSACQVSGRWSEARAKGFRTRESGVVPDQRTCFGNLSGRPTSLWFLPKICQQMYTNAIRPDFDRGFRPEGRPGGVQRTLTSNLGVVLHLPGSGSGQLIVLDVEKVVFVTRDGVRKGDELIR